MNVERILTRLRKIFLVLGGSISVIGVVLMGAGMYAGSTSSLTEVEASLSNCEQAAACGPVQYGADRQVEKIHAPFVTPSPASSRSLVSGSGAESTIQTGPETETTPDPTLPAATPSPTPSPSPSQPDTLSLSRPVPPTPGKTPVAPTAPPTVPAEPTLTVTVTTPPSTQNAAELVASDSYTSTDQVHARSPDRNQDDQAVASCPAGSAASFDLIPFVGPPAKHPDRHHADLKLDLRGYTMTGAFLDLVSYIGPPETGAPQLAGLFQPHRGPNFKAGLQVNSWQWNASKCGGGRYGCPGPPIDTWDVTLVALPAQPGEPIFIPERGPEIYRGGYKVLVLYAEERRLTLGYTREDSVANGYAVHIENICVDSHLLALYRAQTDAAGWHTTGHLPAVRNNQAVGTAAGSHILVAIRDRGSFMDPRAKEWWQGY